MVEDFALQLFPPDNVDNELLKWMLLIDFQERLQGLGKEVLFAEIGKVTEEMQLRVAVARRQHNLFHECREVREEINYDNEEMLMGLRSLAIKSDYHDFFFYFYIVTHLLAIVCRMRINAISHSRKFICWPTSIYL